MNFSAIVFISILLWDVSAFMPKLTRISRFATLEVGGSGGVPRGSGRRESSPQSGDSRRGAPYPGAPIPFKAGDGGVKSKKPALPPAETSRRGAVYPGAPMPFKAGDGGVKSKKPALSGATDGGAEEEEDEEFSGETSKDIKLGDEERLQKVIARAGISSRRGAEALIADGRVLVNGKPVIEAGTKVNPKKDIIVVDGKKLSLPDAKGTLWLVVNKPKAVLTTMSDDKKGDKDRRTLLDLIPQAQELRMVPVGTMERDSTGLMLLTNDVGWIHPLTHHSFQQTRRYEVVVGSFPEESSLDLLRKGGLTCPEDSALGLPPLRPCTVNIIDVDRAAGLVLLDLALEESRSQQVQRMMELANCGPVVSIKRTGFGPLRLSGLRRGQWRELTAAEVTRLKSSCRKAAPLDDAEGAETAPRKVGKGLLATVLRKGRAGRSQSKSKKSKPGSGYQARTEALRAQGTKVDDSSKRQQGRPKR